MDAFKHINGCNDIAVLKRLDEYVDMDIAGIGNTSEIMNNMLITIHGLTKEELEKKQLIGFNKMKTAIHNRIKELSV